MAAPPDPGARVEDLPDQGTRLSQTGRVEAFSDGVMAIAITLLVLDLKVPSNAEAREAGSLITALAGHWPSYLAYLAAWLTVRLSLSRGPDASAEAGEEALTTEPARAG